MRENRLHECRTLDAETYWTRNKTGPKTRFDIEVRPSISKLHLRHRRIRGTFDIVLKIFDIEVCGLDIQYRGFVFDIEVSEKSSISRAQLRY